MDVTSKSHCFVIDKMKYIIWLKQYPFAEEWHDCRSKNPFCLIKFCINFLAFSAFLHKQCRQSIFPPAFGVCNTQMLVEIYNKWLTWITGPGLFYYSIQILPLNFNIWPSACSDRELVCLHWIKLQSLKTTNQRTSKLWTNP